MRFGLASFFSTGSFNQFQKSILTKFGYISFNIEIDWFGQTF